MNIYRKDTFSDNQLVTQPILRELELIRTDLEQTQPQPTDQTIQEDLGQNQPTDQTTQDLGQTQPTDQNVSVDLPNQDLTNDLDFLIYNGSLPN